MKNKPLLGTIGLLVGVVVMQWTMSSVPASAGAVTADHIVALASPWVLLDNGQIWVHDDAPDGQWQQYGAIPVPVEQVHHFEGTWLSDTSGNVWRPEGTNPGFTAETSGQLSGTLIRLT